MAGSNRNVGNTVPRCFKHHPTWQSRVQQLLNTLRDSLIPKTYLGRFNNLLCTCGQGYVADRPDIAIIWEEVTDEQLAHAVIFVDNFIAQNIGNANVPMLKKMMEWLRKDKEINEENSSVPQPASRSSALKLLYLIQMVIEKKFDILQPHKPKAPVQQSQKKMKKEQLLTIILEDYKPELVGQLIGFHGQNLLTFMKEQKCHVTIEKVKMDEVDSVKATIKKTTDDMAVLEKIAEELRKFAKDTQEIVEAYQPPSSDDEEDMTQDQAVDGNENNQMDQEQATLPQPVSNISSLSIGESKNEVSGTEQSSNSASNTVQDSQSGASSLAEATNEMADTSTLVQPVDLNDPARDPCPTKCVVHDRRWVSTYQYVLTQCYTHIRLQKKLGSRFSRLICTCDKQRPEARLYFVVEDHMVKAFDQCKEKIERWPQECQTVVKPLINQLEKYDRSEVWHSLFKFVFYFNSVDSNLMDVLDVDHKLPGQSLYYVPRKEKPYFYQASLPLTVVGPGSSTTTQSTSTLAGASGTSTVQSGAGAASSSIFGRSSLYGSSLFKSEPENQSTEKRATLKRLCPDDWSDDCYYHGKKKKFAFQCVVNYLHKNAGLPVKLNIPFSMAVCVCKEEVDFKEYYKTEKDCEQDCREMRSKLNTWRGDSKASIQQYLKLLEDYMYHRNITDGFLKFVYHFNKVQKRELSYFESLHRLVRRQRNEKKT